MSGYALFGGGLELAAGLTELALHWLVQSTLVIAVGLAVAALLRKRTPALRSVVYQTTLLTALACPAAACLLSTAGLTFIAIELPSARYERLEIVPAPPEPVEVVPQPVSPPSEPFVQSAADDELRPEQAEAGLADPLLADQIGPNFSQPAPAPFDPLTAAAPQTVAEDPPAPLQPPAPAATMVRRIVGTRPFIAALFLGVPIVWGLITLALLARLALDHLRLAKLRRTAAPVDELSEGVCLEVAQRLNVPPPRLLRTPLVTSPCLSGVFFPTVLLPEEISEASLSAVMVHELAHLKRGDCFWNLLRHIGTALLWPQPLMWRLSHRMEAAAEDVCDDYVVEFGESRTAYAETLLTIAERNLLPASGAAVSLVTFRSMLGQRVQRILDHSRRLTLTVGLAALTLVAVGGVSAGLVAGLLGPRSNEANAVAPRDIASDEKDEKIADDTPPNERDDNDQDSLDESERSQNSIPANDAAPSETAKAAPPDDDLVTVRGTVLDPSGQPRADAEVVAIPHQKRFLEYPEGPPQTPVSTTRSDVAGNFEISFRKSQSELGFDDRVMWEATTIAAIHPDYGPGYTTYGAIKDQQPATLTLVPDQPIHGRLVDLEGRPIAGATLKLGGIGRNEAEDLSRWIAAIRDGIGYYNSQRYNRPAGISAAMRVVHPDPIKTDGDGRFSLAGVGRNRYVILRCNAAGMANADLHVVTSPVEPFVVDYGSAADFKHLKTYYGSDFQFAAAPSQVVEGVVRDSVTKRPLAGARVILDKLAGTMLGGIHAAETISDGEGRYRLEGMPRGEGNELLVVPPVDQPYFIREFDNVPVGDDFAPVHLDLELKRGIWITGRISERETGEPISARMYYLPWPDNPHLDDKKHNDHRPHGVRYDRNSDSDGRYRLVGLPGRGLVASWCLNKPYPPGQGVLEISDLPSKEEFNEVVGSIGPSEQFPTIVREINPTEGTDQSDVDLQVSTGGPALEVEFVDSAGQPIPDAMVQGLWPKASGGGGFASTTGATAQVLGLEPGEDRLLIIHQKERNLGKVIAVRLADATDGKVQITLEPCVKVTARLLDSEGDPVRAARVEAQPSTEGDYALGLPRVETDDDGKFTNTLVPGCTYNLQCNAPQTVGLESIARELAVAPGETIDLGEFDVTSDARPEPKRTRSQAAVSSVAVPPATGDELVTSDDLVTVRGTVLDPDGKPRGGAKVLALGWSVWNAPLADTRTDAEGKFSVQFSKSKAAGESPQGWRATELAAVAEGFAPGWITCSALSADNQATLRLVTNAAIEGRIVDLEGRPVAGATLSVRFLGRTSTGDLKPWLDTLRDGAIYSQPHANKYDQSLGLSAAPLFSAATTDSDGNFRLDGLGPQTMVRLQLVGGGVVTTDLDVLTISMEPIVTRFGNPEPYFERDVTLFGAKFQYAAEPSQPVAGTVTDSATGKPLAGVRVLASQFAGKRTHEWEPVTAVTDEQGAYRLDGMPRGEGNRVLALRAQGQPYFYQEVDVPVGDALQPTKLDIAMRRGVLIRGRLSRRDNGAPIKADIKYAPWPDNPALATADFQPASRQETLAHADEQGRFEVVGLPGAGLLLFTCRGEPLPAGQGIDELGGLPGEAFRDVTGGTGISPSAPTAIHKLNIPADATEITADVALDAGERVTIEVVDAAGLPVSGLEVKGIGPVSNPGHKKELPSRFEVLALKPNEKRWVLIDAPARKLGRALQITYPVENQPLQVVLDPYATVTARLLDGNGDPIREGYVSFSLPHADNWGFDASEMRTDSDGRLRATSILPGASYDIVMAAVQTNWQPLAKKLTVASGEIIELGEFDVTSDARPEPRRTLQTANAKAATPPAPADDDLVTVRGTVLDPSGQPRGGVAVAAVRWYWGLDDPRTPLSTTTTDGAGQFSISYRKAQFGRNFGRPDQWREAAIVATAPGFGPGWTYYGDIPIGEPAELQLAEDHPIQGRIVDLEGQPIEGASIRVDSIYRNKQEDISRWIDAVRKGIPFFGSQDYDRPEDSLFVTGLPLGESILSDEEGRFEIRGIGRNRYVNLKLSGGGVAVASLRAVSMPVEDFVVDFGQGPFKNPVTYFGSRFEFVAEPSQPVEGVVRDAKTGQPLAGVRVVADKLAGGRLSGIYAATTTSDESGRYRLEGLPKGIGNGILAVPGDELPYFMREFRDVPTAPGLAPVNFDLDLHRGIWVTGRLVEKGSGAPVRARMFYLPWPDNPHIKDLPEFNSNHLHGAQSRYETDLEGRFRLVGLPGRALVAAVCVVRPYPTGQGVREIADLPPKEVFNKVVGVFAPTELHPTAVHEIRPADDAQQVEVEFQIDPGKSLKLHITDDAGLPISGSSIVGLWPKANSHRADNLGSSAEMVALNPEERRLVLVHHAERQLGTAIELGLSDAKDGQATVLLQRCATLKVRLVNEDREPLVGVLVRCHPGGYADFGLELPTVATDENGVINMSALLPGCKYDISAESPQIAQQSLARGLEVAPGETIDLGEFDPTQEERPQPKRTPGEKQPAREIGVAPAAAANGAPTNGEPAPLVVRGVVLNPDGKPAANVSVKLIRSLTASKWAKDVPPATTQTDASGRFEIEVPQILTDGYRGGQPWPLFGVMVKAVGFAGTHLRLDTEDSIRDAVVHLTPFAPLEGRIVNLEGQPVPGVNVQLHQVNVTDSGNLEPYLAALRAGTPAKEIDESIKPSFGWGDDELRKANTAVTDADGRFRLNEVGRHHIALLRLSGGGIVLREIEVANAPTEPVSSGDNTRRGDTDLLFGSPFEFAAEPSPPIEGVVRDAETGQPISGVKIASTRYEEINKYGFSILEVVTDGEGRYRLEGVRPKPNRGELQRFIVRSTGEVPYLPQEFDAPEAGNDLGPITHDIALHRGIWIEGRVTDAASGKPVAAKVEYLPWHDNPRVEHLPEYQGNGVIRLDGTTDPNTDADGRYRLIGIPGRGVVQISRVPEDNYPMGQGFDAIPELPGDAEKFKRLGRWNVPRAGYNVAIKEFNASDDAKRVQVDIALQPGKTVKVSTVDPDGKPIAVTEAHGLAASHILRTHREPGAKLEVVGLTASETRTVLLVNLERRLGAMLEIHLADDPSQDRTVTLVPLATITGRLVDANGLPLPRPSPRDYINLITEPHGRTLFAHMTSADDDGRFELLAVPGNLDYRVYADNAKDDLAQDLRVAPGETIDLGTIDGTSQERPPIKRTPAKKPAADATAASTTADNSPAKPSDAFQFAGKVVGPAGQPAAGAKLYLLLNSLSVTKPQLVGESAADGQFRFSLPRDRFFEGEARDAWWMAKLVARADGRGIAWALLASFDSTGELLKTLPPSPNLSDRTKDIAEDQTLHLAADDVPIQGRIVDLEGNPVVGARVRLLDISRSANDNLDAWLEAAQSKSESFEAWKHIPVSTGYYLQSQLEGLFQDVKTNDDGRFEIQGIGRERVAWLQIEGPNIETRHLYARTRSGEPIAVPDPRQPKMEPRVYYGATFDFVVGPTRPIQGIVRDADSGTPLPGVTVQPYRLANGWLQPFPNATFYTVTDREGRYVLTGLPIGSNTILATGPSDEPYLASEQPAEVNPSAKQVAVDINLKRGVWIRGRVIDAASQEPLRAAVEYHVFLDNPQRQKSPGLSDAFVRRSQTNSDGRFRIAGLPGRGVLGVRADDFAAYPKAAGADKIEGGDVDNGMIFFKTAPSTCSANDYHAVAGVNVIQDGNSVECNFALVPGKIVTGTVVDPDGKPLSSAVIYGSVASVAWRPLADTTFAIKGLEPGKPRYVQFYHARRNLAGSLSVNGDEQEPLTVKLAPAGTLIGRLLDAEGNVPASIRIVSIREGEHRGTLPGKWAHDIEADGRFKIEGIPPGESYIIAAYVPQEGLRRLAEEIELSSAEVKDLGVLTLPDRKKKPIATTVGDDKSTAPAAMSKTAAAFEFTGTVLDPAGKPKPAAQVALLYYNGKRPVLSPPTTTTDDGGFLLHVPHDLVASDDANSAILIVTSPGQTPIWDRAALFESSGELLKLLESHYLYDEFVARSKDRTLRLVADDVPISGRIVNLEGQGVAGARVRVRTIYANPIGNLDAWLKGAESGEFELDQLWNHVPESISGRISGEAIGHLLPEVVADADGRFKLTGIGRDRLVELLISADGLETCPVHVRTRPGEALQLPRDATNPDAGSETCFGPSFDYALAPSRPIVGVVRDVDTGDPLAGIQVVPELIAGNRMHSTIANDYLQDTTDAEGRYRLAGLPIGASKIAAVPPRDVPFAAASLEVETDPARESTTLDFQLKRGIWIRGRVTDAQSGQPVRGRVEYFVFNSNPHRNDAPGLMDIVSYHGWVKEDGRYQIVGLPGPGLISFLANDGSIGGSIEKYPRGTGADAIEGTGEGPNKFLRTSPYMLPPVNTHYVASIDPEPTSEAIEHDIRLEAGQALAGKVYDPERQPLAGATCTGLSNIGIWSELKTDEFEVRHLPSGEKRRLYFYHAERNLAASIEVSGDEKSPLVVKLVPAGTIKGRLLLEDGDPAARVSLWQTHEGREPRGVLPGGQAHLTDADGRFQISGIIPGLYYSIRASRGNNSLGTALENVTVAVGETKDLGDLTIAAPEN